MTLLFALLSVLRESASVRARSTLRKSFRRATEVALHLAEAGLLVVVALISPLEADRATAAERLQRKDVSFAEVFVNAPLEVCARRDPKGLYRKARAGMLPAFTGIDAPYAIPRQPALEIRTDLESLPESIDRLTSFTLAFVRARRQNLTVANGQRAERSRYGGPSDHLLAVSTSEATA